MMSKNIKWYDLLESARVLEVGERGRDGQIWSRDEFDIVLF